MTDRDGGDRDEALREALLELSLLREREASALRESEALVDGLASMNAAGSPSRALGALLASIRASLDCDAAVLLTAEDDRAAIRQATDPALIGHASPGLARALARPMRVAEADRIDGWQAAPPPLRRHRSLVSTPLALPDGGSGAILCLAAQPDAFGPAQQRLLKRLAALAAQGLAALGLAERNALLAAVIDGSSASVAIADATDPALPLIYVNDAFTDLSGHPREAAIGRNCRFLSAEPRTAPERARLRAAVAARVGGSFVLRNRRADGTAFWNRLTLFPVRDGEGRTTHLVATQIDVTAELDAAEERDIARRRMTAALSASSKGMLVLDPDGHVVFANPTWHDLFDPDGRLFPPGARYDAAWASVRSAQGATPEGARAEAAARLAALYGDGDQREQVLPDGRILLVTDRPTEDGGAVSLATDITALKAAERALAQRAAAIDAAQDGIALTDGEGRFVYMNPAHVTMFGFERDAELLGRPWSVLYEPERAAWMEREVMPVLMRTGRWRGEVAGRARDGTPIEQEVSLTFLADIGIVCVTRDVGERHLAERERARLSDQLAIAQRQEAVGQLAAGVAHDFNNLLSVIGAGATMLEPAVEGTPGAADHLARIAAATQRAGQLVRGLMDLGARRGEPRRIDLRDVVREAENLLRAGVPNRVRLQVALPDSPVEVEADPTELLQVLLNLGINGRDALGPEGGTVSIRLRAADAPAVPDPDAPFAVGALLPGRRYAAIEVADTGCGMSEAERVRVFRPYYTTKGEAGTGLGLVVVSSVVSKVGGAVALRSAPGEGAAFTVHWPLDAAAATGLPGPAGAPPLAAAAPDPEGDAAAMAERLDGALVLVCDDMGDVGRAIGGLLERAGAEVALSEHPSDALEALSEDPESWSLLVTDYDMPGMTGAELAAAARRTAPGLAVLLCSAWADSLGDAGPVDAVMPKPVTRARLAEVVMRALVARDARLAHLDVGAPGASSDAADRAEP